MSDMDTVSFSPATMSHATMVARWRRHEAHPVSSRITDYVLCDDVWWRRTGGAWESVPDSPLALSLYAGRATLSRLEFPEEIRGRDPWSASRNRRRIGHCQRAL